MQSSSILDKIETLVSNNGRWSRENGATQQGTTYNATFDEHSKYHM